MRDHGADSLLSIDRLNAWYGESHVLHGIGLEVPRGEVVVLFGRNGAGKTTLLKSIMNLVPRRSGGISWKGQDISALKTYQIALAGIAFCPENRQIFASLNVLENLTLAPVINQSRWSLDAIYALFPNLLGRSGSQGTKLSGGEQQMLAIARILRAGPELMLLDEPTEGLAPAIVGKIAEAIAEMKQAGLTILLVEQNLEFALSLADRAYVIENGCVVDSMDRDGFSAGRAAINRYMGI